MINICCFYCELADTCIVSCKDTHSSMITPETCGNTVPKKYVSKSQIVASIIMVCCIISIACIILVNIF